MRTKSIIPTAFIALLAVVSACGDKTANNVFATDSVKCEQKTKGAEVTIHADYPTEGSEALRNSVAEYISESLGGTYEGALANGDTVVGYYAKAISDELSKQYSEEMEAGSPPFASWYDIVNTVDTTHYITYTTYYETITGGAHGMPTLSGTTFRKDDGRRFGWEMLRNTWKDEFHLLLKESVKSYFEAQEKEKLNDEQLKDWLIGVDDVNYFPLPQATPYLDKEGVAFVYQPYEIAPYAAGIIEFTIPFDKMKPYLTATAKKLIAQ